MGRFRIWTDQLWAIGRRSERAYLRFYPNPGFMFPWGSKRIVWSKFYGWIIRPAGSRRKR